MEERDKTCKYYKSCGHEVCHDIDFTCEEYEPVGEEGYYGE